MAEHVARLVTTSAAAGAAGHGAALRVSAVRHALEAAGYAVDPVRRPCLAVAVSYACAGRVRRLRAQAPSVWLDVTDSWLLTDASGLRSGDVRYAARLVRDGWRLARMPIVDLATWISAADRRVDRSTVGTRRALVLPQVPLPPAVRRRPPGSDRRLVLSGDWGYAPNRDGLGWFARRVLPRLHANVEVYGRGAPAGPWNARGYVDDEGALYQEGDLHVAPVRFGAGVKNKVLRPALAGLPVLTTTQGAHGLRPHPLIRVADDADAFVDQVERWQAAPDAPPSPAAPADLLDGDDSDAVRAWLAAQQVVCRLHG